jgi:hypothetical protein
MALISDDYRRLNAEMHVIEPAFGAGAKKSYDRTRQLCEHYKTEDVLDYGCGKATLREKFSFIKCYDPAIPEHSKLPEPADLVICRDVMEHVEDESIDEVLDHVKSLAKKAAFFLIVFRESGQFLPDGRNTHISVHPKEWWEEKLRARWSKVRFWQDRPKDGEFVCE